MTSTPGLAERAVLALERIADAVEKIAGARDAATWSPPAAVGGEWKAAMLKRRPTHRAHHVFHAVRSVADTWITGCGGGRRGIVDAETLRPLDQVPNLKTSEWRCDTSGCVGIFAQHPARTESS